MKEILNDILLGIKKVFELICKHKKMLLIGIIALVIICLIVILVNKNANKPLDIVDFVSKDVKVYNAKKTNRLIASKYELKNYKLTVANKSVKLEDLKASLLYLRSNDMNADIVQGRYLISPVGPDGEPPLVQINLYMDRFKTSILTAMNKDINREPDEKKLYGESQYNFELPIEESIYVEKRLYSLTYKISNEDGERITYDMNFFMDDDYLVCELVKML